ncbi:MAG: glucose-1-phosphate cytidylyltransferase [Alphaproteobacteria bacterium]|nr:glucose-1-phosphate cytidylyltransferase [Alphaproteobacteria bacterium]
MKTVILAGGLGTRLAERTHELPKPMVEIGGRPILWHVMKVYERAGFEDFCVALGYRGEAIKSYFLNYYTLSRDLSVNLSDGAIDRHKVNSETWNVHLIDTGQKTNTGGRIRRLQEWIGNERFMLTYGDGVCDIDVRDVIATHERTKALVTILAVRPPARFGGLVCNENQVVEFTEKPQIGEGWINGGFMVCEPGIFDYLSSDEDSLEKDALEAIAADGKLAAHFHEDFWQCMDTLRELRLLQELWDSGNPPWLRKLEKSA